MDYKQWEQESKNYVGTMNYYKLMKGWYLTDGTNALAKNFDCALFLAFILERLKVKEKVEQEGFVSVKINVGKKATVILEDGNDNKLATVKDIVCVLPSGKYEFWCEQGLDGIVAYLPSEH